MTRQCKITGLPFKPDIVRANLDDRKTQTRRTRGLQKVNEEPDQWEFWRMYDGVAKFVEKHNNPNEIYIKCPYGQKGDILYVKETYMEPVLYDGAEQDYYYAADYPNPKEAHLRDPHIGGKWKPGMFMPQKAARIWMEVVDSYPERLQDITEKDAIAEGIDQEEHIFVGSVAGPYAPYEEFKPPVSVWQRKDYLLTKKKGTPHYSNMSAKDCFKTLFISINGQEGWDRNIWVWVVRYKILSKTGKPEGI